MSPETSIIIRAKNEEGWIGTVLKRLFEQTYQNFEVVIVDSGSTDRTLKIAKQFPVKIFEILPQDFSYPYALNYGVAKSSATTYIVIISAHSIPISPTWLEDGLDNFARCPKIMGVYGPLRPLPGAVFWDKFFMNGINFLRGIWMRKNQYLVCKGGMGVLGFTNAIILKELWSKRHFNEDYGAGGEDGEWANYWFERGYKVVKDKKFTVLHSHNLGLWGWHKQWRYWKSLSGPRPFRPQDFTFRKSDVLK